MKTLQQQKDSKLPFNKFLKVGDNVDFTIIDYFIENDPIVMNSLCLQIEEPSYIKERIPYYLTLEKIKGKWVYAGIKPEFKLN